MIFSSYPFISTNTSSINNGYYINPSEEALFISGYSPDIWFGTGINDTIECSVWDKEQNLVGYKSIYDEKLINNINLTFLSSKENPSEYTYPELITEYTLYLHEKILVNHPVDVQTVTGNMSGSYYVTYNFTRNMAGSSTNPLVINGISTSRKELKLMPLYSASLNYIAFCNKKLLMSDVSSLYIQAVSKCPYDKIYTDIKDQYKNEIELLKSTFYLKNDGEVVSFISKLYEDLVVYSYVSTSEIEGKLTTLFGIRTHFNNYILSHLNDIISFDDINKVFSTLTSTIIDRKFLPIGLNPSLNYVNAKSFLHDFFVKYYFNGISNIFYTAYVGKYHSYLKNAINFGNNKLLPILNTGMIEENGITYLLVKLAAELPENINVQDTCWVSNIAMLPQIVSSIIFSNQETKLKKIGGPNFSVVQKNAWPDNFKLSYTYNDLKDTAENSRNISINKKVAATNIDYSSFSNFVVFSSAELRLKVFKNKVISIESTKLKIATLDEKNEQFKLQNGIEYPFYQKEKDSMETTLNEIIYSFDGYESYLYNSGNYIYENGTFVNSDYVNAMDESARVYDIYNRDSLINNCPKYILTNQENDDYIIFLSMIGHFFDEIYSYITSLPMSKTEGMNAADEFTRKMVDHMLSSFGWNIDDILENDNIFDNYTEYSSGGNSSESRLKTIRNRILDTLPEIYKSKGTEYAIRLLLSCYGIPSSLLNIREFGGTDITATPEMYVSYDKVYLYQWTSASNDTFILSGSNNIQTYLLKIVGDTSEYAYGRDYTLFGKVTTTDSSSISASGEWAMGFIPTTDKISAKAFFRIGYTDAPSFKLETPEFPLFDGNIYSIMLRKNDPSEFYQSSSNIDIIPSEFELWVGRNDGGTQMICVSGSKILYDEVQNHIFNSNSGSFLKLGGWFNSVNSSPFVGAIDKLQLWKPAITNNAFQNYVNDINSYASNEDKQNLIFRMHTDYPFDVTLNEKWDNSNDVYATHSLQKQNVYFGTVDAVCMDYMSLENGSLGNHNNVYDTSSCNYVSVSAYPYQFREIEYKNTIPTSNYGSNRYRNTKIKHFDQQVSTRLDSNSRSTYIPYGELSGDSNKIGIFIDPQDFKNKDIVRYFGDYDLIGQIGEADNAYLSEYSELKKLRKKFAEYKNQNLGGNTLFTELLTLYRFYFNKSIFRSVKNIIPARCNLLYGVVVEPTILERPKYQLKPIESVVNSGSSEYLETNINHYSNDTCSTSYKIVQSIDSGDFNTDFNSIGNFNQSSIPSNNVLTVDMTHIHSECKSFPTNYGGNDIGPSDKYYMGHYIGGVNYVPTYTPENTVIAEFSANITDGYSPLQVLFNNLSINATAYTWNFGDGTTSNEVNPSHIYSSPGTYTVSLTASNELAIAYNTKESLINVSNIPSVIPCDGPFSKVAYGNSTDYIKLGSKTGPVQFSYNAWGIPDRYIITQGNETLLDTGYVKYSGTRIFNKTSTDAYITASVITKSKDKWSWVISCP